jgi:MoxR-like ATPase
MEKMPQHSEPAAVEPEENLHMLAEERKAYKEALEEENLPQAILSDAEKAIQENKEKFAALPKEWNPEKPGWLARFRERLAGDKEKVESDLDVDMAAVLESLGPDAELYQEIDALEDKLEDISDFEMKRMREVKTDPHARKAHERLLATARKEREGLQEKLAVLERQGPLIVRAHDLVEYKEDLSAEGHIAHTPSVERYKTAIARRMISGKPMFLHGPTGTGKTSLARSASEDSTGRSPEMVYCNPQTRESNIWGKTGIKPTENGGIETIDVYGPLSRAMRDGTPVIFDEFTALPREQMVFIKGVFNAKPGDTVNIMGNGTVEIQPGFQMIFTANLKSEKNPERQELPPEIAREFEQNNLEVGYTPKEEAYDIVLARLMNPDGSLDASHHDLSVTIPKFLEAMEEVQLAYTDKASETAARLTGSMDASGKRPGLKKLVFTQGSVEAILDDWKTEKVLNANDHPSFAEFLDGRLKTALTFKEYPEADRVLAAKILASKGLLRTISAADLGLPESVFAFDAAKKQRGSADSLRELSSTEQHLSLKEVADLDPFQTRVRAAAEVAESFLPEEERKSSVPERAPSAESLPDVEAFLAQTYKGWGVDQSKLDAINFSPEFASPADVDYAARKADTDPSKYGEYVMNPDTAGIDWDSIPPAKIHVETLEGMQGKKLDEIAAHIQTTFGSRYRIPGLEYYKYICEHPDKAPASMKDGNYYFMFGSLFRHSDGYWRIPCVSGASSGFKRNGDGLGKGWYGNYRVVLLEK